MNIWALNKDESIKLLLLLLKENFDLENIHFLLTEDIEDRAIRMSDKENAGLSAYVYSYGQQQNHYGVHLEYPAQESHQSYTLEIFEELSLDRLLSVLSVHFNFV